MFSRMLNNFNDFPLCDAMPMGYPYPNFPPAPCQMDDVEMPRCDSEESTDYSRQPTVPIGTNQPGFQMPSPPPVQKDISYTQGWLSTQIGKYIKIEFLIGTNMLIDREGLLKEVGVSYVVIIESGSNDLLMCDLYSIKFVRVYSDQEKLLKCK